MKIGIVCYPTFGGSGVVATELGMALANQGHTVHFISYNRPVRLLGYSTNIFYHEVVAQNYPLFDHLPFESALVSKIVDVARYAGLDVLHVHYALPHASAAYMARQILRDYGCNLPFITTLHGTDITLVGRDESYKPIVTFSINQSDIITTVSDSLRRDTYQNFPIQKAIEVVHNFIDLKRYRPKQERPSGFREHLAHSGEKVLIHVSNFRKVKRVPDVLEIFRIVREKRPVRLMLVGDGPELAHANREVRKQGWMGEVIFLGKQDAIEHVLPLGDVFLMPSEAESFGLAALEAMACGLPVIGTQAGGMPELVENSSSGFLSPVGDVEAMAQHTIVLLDDIDTFSLKAAERAQVFDSHNIVPQYEALYARLVGVATPRNQPN